MKQIYLIARRDLVSMFTSLRGYVVMSLVMLLFGVFFYFHLKGSNEASMRDMFMVMNFLFLFIVPLFTMGALSEERRAGTLFLLLTCPVSRGQIVAGKFIACATFYTLAVSLTLEFVLLLTLAGSPDPGPIATGYMGLLLSGYLAISVGLYTSSLTPSPLVAALSCYAFLFLAWILSAIPQFLTGELATWVDRTGIVAHLASFETGLISFRDTSYFVLGILCWMSFTIIGFSQERENPSL